MEKGETVEVKANWNGSVASSYVTVSYGTSPLPWRLPWGEVFPSDDRQEALDIARRVFSKLNEDVRATQVPLSTDQAEYPPVTFVSVKQGVRSVGEMRAEDHRS